MLKFKLPTLIALLISFVNLAHSAEVNIYSHRQPFLINPFLEAFSNKTGIKTNVVYSTKGLAQRLKAEGKNSPADLILTVDIGRLHIYQDMGLLASISSNKLDKNIPSHLKHLPSYNATKHGIPFLFLYFFPYCTLPNR